MLDALDHERSDQLLVVEHPYFEMAAPTRWETPLSYTDSEKPIGHPVTYEWNHGLGEVVQAVLEAGLRLTRLEEHQESESAFFDWMVPTERGRYVLTERRERLPLMYTLEALKEHGNP